MILLLKRIWALMFLCIKEIVVLVIIYLCSVDLFHLIIQKVNLKILGLHLNGDLKNPVLDPDKGRGANFNVEMYMGSIKTPTLQEY
jgi:hypothetical protein